MNILIDVLSQSANNYVLLVVDDRASNFPLGFLLETKQAIGVARKLLQDLCLIFGVPKCIGCSLRR